MSERGVTTITLKQINKEKVYQYIYRTKQTSKLQIVQDLKMGLSTVSQNLNVLEEEASDSKRWLFRINGWKKGTGDSDCIRCPDFNRNWNFKKNVLYCCN